MFGRKQKQVVQSRLEALSQHSPAKQRPVPRAIVPRAQREPCFADCQVWYAGSVSIAGVIIDRSASGVRVRFHHRHALPERVRISCPRLDIDRMARVVRRLDFDIGMQFID